MMNQPKSPQSIINEALSEDEEEDLTEELESNANNSISESPDFPTSFGREDNNSEGSTLPQPFHHDSNWDSFFNGHADNIEKDIHSLSRGTDDATAPPDYHQSEDQGDNGAEEEGQSPSYVSQSISLNLCRSITLAKVL